MNEKDLLAQIEHTNDRLWSYDKNLICTVANSFMSNDYEQAFGKKLIVGMSVLEGVPEEIARIWRKRYERALRGEQFSMVDQFEIEGVPEYVEVSFNPILEKDEVVGVACCSKDISEKKRAEIKLSESEANLYAQIENTTESIWSVDKEYRLVTTNSVFQEGFSHNFNCDLQIGDVVPDCLDEPLRSLWQKRYDRSLNGEHFIEVDQYDLEIGTVYVEFSFNPVKIENDIVGVACFSRDITLLKSSEVQKMQAIESRDKLFSIISHDLRGPMSNILNLTKLLGEHAGNVETTSNIVEMLTKSANSVNNLLDNLLNWTQAQQGKIELHTEKIALIEVIESSIDAYKINAALKDISVEVEIDPIIEVNVDRHTISSVIANLFNNAVKFTNENGTIQFKAKLNSKQVEVSVIDDGVGMSQETMASVFSEASVKSTQGTSAEKGTGLGLQLCKEFLRMNNSVLHVKSKQGKGSTFSFSLSAS